MRRATWTAARQGRGVTVKTPRGIYPLSRTEAQALRDSLQRALSDGCATARAEWAAKWMPEHPNARHRELAEAMTFAGLAPISAATMARMRREMGLPKLKPGPAGRGAA